MKNLVLLLLFCAIVGLSQGLSFAPNTTFCKRNPCKNSGVCVVEKNKKEKCYCMPGYEGKKCQIALCPIKPCQNGGTCDGPIGYCVCRPGFSGYHCEKRVCKKNTCKNGGKCVATKNGFYCDCKSPYAGTRCTIKCNIVADIMLVLDESGSIKKRRFSRVIDFVISIIKVFDIANKKVRIGLITFSSNVFFHFDLKTYNNKLDLITMVDLLRYNYSGGATNTEKALRYLDYISFTKNHGDRPTAPNYVFMITDGRSRHPKETASAAYLLKAKGTTIFTFGFGFNVNERELCSIASPPSSTHVIRQPYSKLRGLMDFFVAKNCKVLKKEEFCTPCTEDCHCASGMRCCNGCCKNTVVLEFCKPCARRNRCASHRHCKWPKNQCFHGCCQNPRFVKIYRCRGNCPKTSKHFVCRPGWKCCRGLCQKPVTLEVSCMGNPLCRKYPPRSSCGAGMKCCLTCDNLPQF